MEMILPVNPTFSLLVITMSLGNTNLAVLSNLLLNVLKNATLNIPKILMKRIFTLLLKLIPLNKTFKPFKEK